jgi:radical SAM-linked protein
VKPGEVRGKGQRPAEVWSYRLQVAKLGGARFLSHLDVLRALLRSMRRAGLPLALSQGFNPQPKVAFAGALALGPESEAEFVDLELAEAMPVVDVASRLARAMPPGFILRQAALAPRRGKALASYEAVCRYEARPLGGDAAGAAGDGAAGQSERIVALGREARRLLDSPSLPVSRRSGKQVELRPLLVTLGVGAGATGEPLVVAELLTGPGGTGRPDDLLRLLGEDPAEWIVKKTDFWPLSGGERLSPWRA